MTRDGATRRGLLATLAAAGALAATEGCEKLISNTVEELAASVPESLSPPAGADIHPTHHLLNRAGYGPRPGDIERVSVMGHDRWIEEQLHPDQIPDELCDLRARRFEELDDVAGACYEYRKPILREEMARHALLRAVYSRRQLFEVLVSFWTDHLNINIEKGDCIYLKPFDDRQVVRKHAMGNFRDLIRASATSAAMLVYLDGNQNTRGKPSDVPNENYGRELLELHTLGVHGGYTQQDVYEAARALTGWRVRPKFMKGTVHFDASLHDQGIKRVLGRLIPAGPDEKDLDDLVDIVCRHPATARHIATKLVRRFVAEEPPRALVERASQVFTASDGDIRQTVRCILSSDEFTSERGGKFKPPFRFVASALRMTGADTHAHSPLIAYLGRMGQGVFQYPTPDGYPDKTSPWLGSLLWRWNFAFALAGNQVPSVQTPVEKLLRALDAGRQEPGVRLFEHFSGCAPREMQRRAFAMAGPAEAMGLALASPSFQHY